MTIRVHNECEWAEVGLYRTIRGGLVNKMMSRDLKEVRNELRIWGQSSIPEGGAEQRPWEEQPVLQCWETSANSPDTGEEGARRPERLLLVPLGMCSEAPNLPCQGGHLGLTETRTKLQTLNHLYATLCDWPKCSFDFSFSWEFCQLLNTPSTEFLTRNKPIFTPTPLTRRLNQSKEPRANRY